MNIHIHPHSIKVQGIKETLKLWRFPLRCFVSTGPDLFATAELPAGRWICFYRLAMWSADGGDELGPPWWETWALTTKLAR